MRLFVAIPSSGNVSARFLHCVTQLAGATESGLRIEQFFGAGVINARIVAANRFVNSTQFTHFLSIDSDMVFDPEQVKRLCGHDEDIVGGFYAKKQEKLEYVCCALPEKPEADSRGLMEMKRIGTGFLMVKRRVFEAMKEKWKDTETFINSHKEEVFNFYPMGVVNREYVSEDWYFCDRARELGFKVYGDTEVVLGHVGDVVYPLK